MMDCVKLPFVFLLIVKLVFAAPYTQDEFKQECDNVRHELVDVPDDKREERLIEKTARARLEKKQEIRKQGRLEEQKNSLQRVQIRLSPYALVASVEKTFQSEYHESMDSCRQKIENLKRKQKDISGSIKKLEDELINVKNMTSDKVNSKKNFISNHTARLSEIPEKIKALEKQLPKVNTENTRSDRIAKRKHLWCWIMENKRNDQKVKEIWKHIEKWYNRKPKPFQDNNSLQDYVDHFCETMGIIYEEASNNAAHILKRIPLKSGFEFEIFCVHGIDELDEFTTILANAVGLRHFLGETLDVDGLLLPGSVTQKIQ